MSSEMRDIKALVDLVVGCISNGRRDEALLHAEQAQNALARALLARTEAGAKCDHAWQPDSDVVNARYCPKCDVTQTIPKKTTHPQDASGDAREAERYRWLRDEASRAQLEMFADRRGTRLAADRVCDAGIDIAMQAKEAK